MLCLADNILLIQVFLYSFMFFAMFDECSAVGIVCRPLSKRAEVKRLFHDMMYVPLYGRYCGRRAQFIKRTSRIASTLLITIGAVGTVVAANGATTVVEGGFQLAMTRLKGLRRRGISTSDSSARKPAWINVCV